MGSRSRRRIPRLHVVTDDEVLLRPGFLGLARQVLAAGAQELALHLRGPGTSGRRIHALAEALLPGARAAGACLLVNDRVDVALAVGLDGVHLGRRSLPPRAARELLGQRFLLGTSVHGAGEAAQAMEGYGARGPEAEAGSEGPDFLVVGALFRTPSHPGRGAGGTGLLGQVAHAAPGTPLVGIGGVSAARVALVRAAGAHGVAVLRGVWDAASPVEGVARYLEALAAPPPPGAGGARRTPPETRESDRG